MNRLILFHQSVYSTKREGMWITWKWSNEASMPCQEDCQWKVCVANVRKAVWTCEMFCTTPQMSFPELLSQWNPWQTKRRPSSSSSSFIYRPTIIVTIILAPITGSVCCCTGLAKQKSGTGVGDGVGWGGGYCRSLFSLIPLTQKRQGWGPPPLRWVMSSSPWWFLGGRRSLHLGTNFVQH